MTHSERKGFLRQGYQPFPFPSALPGALHFLFPQLPTGSSHHTVFSESSEFLSTPFTFFSSQQTVCIEPNREQPVCRVTFLYIFQHLFTCFKCKHGTFWGVHVFVVLPHKMEILRLSGIGSCTAYPSSYLSLIKRRLGRIALVLVNSLL